MARVASAWTAAELDTEIAATKTAIGAARAKRAYTINGRNLVLQELDKLTKYLDYLVAEKNKLDSPTGIRVRRWVGKR